MHHYKSTSGIKDHWAIKNIFQGVVGRRWLEARFVGTWEGSWQPNFKYKEEEEEGDIVGTTSERA